MQLSTALNLPNRQVSAGGFGYGSALALDFTSGKQALDPRITFTRASTATYFNSAGVLTTTGFNLLTYSEQFDNAAWTKTQSSIVADTVVAPNGTLTGDLHLPNTTAAEHSVAQSFSFVSGTTYTISIYLKAAGYTQCRVRFQSAAFGGAAQSVDVDLTDGTAVAVSGTPIATITNVGNGWYRVTSTATASTTISAAISVFPKIGGSTTAAGDGTSGIYIWGAQLETGSAATVYIPTTSATSGAARFDYDPVTLAPKGLLIEESRTNLLTYSEQFDNAVWLSAAPYTVVADTAISPDGTQDADSLIVASGSSSFSTNVTRQVVIKAASAIQYTRSGYFKALGATTSVRFVDFGSTTANSASVIVSLVDGSIVTLPAASGSFTGASATISDAGNGWWRIALTYTTDAFASLTVRSFPYVGNTSLTGDGTSGLLVYGAQLEAGAFATSYIPTVASQVTRAADVATMTGTNFSSWYNQSEGTFFVSSDYTLVVGGNYRFDVTDGTSSNQMRLRSAPSGSTQSRFELTTSGVAQTTLSPSTTNPALNKDAIAYKLDDAAAVVNAGTAGVDTSLTPATMNQMAIGATRLGASPINGHIQRIAYYNRRLTNAELQGITS